MISKGTTHDNGGRLARYMVTGKAGETAELWELRGFASPDIVDAFRSVHVMAEATKCHEPFFHVQIRNPQGEALSREQWEYTANRIERMLGLKDQPRAIAFHIEEQTGDRHMHIAWSRIDDETMTARPLPYYKERLKKISRELELHFGITVVPNERESSIKYAPTRAEDEQARRLGLDVHAGRQTIRDCFERSDGGRGFEAALADHGMILAQGERRDYVVIDQAGGMHALGKRILGTTAAETRQRLADLPRENLPSVEQAKDFIREQAETRRQEEQAPVWDRDRDDIRWQDAVVTAAIEKEKVEGRYAEKEGTRRAAGEKNERSPFEPPMPTMPQAPQLNQTSPEYWFEDVAKQVTQDNRPHDPPETLRGVAKQISTAFQHNHDPAAFVAALDEQGIALAAVTKDEADRSHRLAEFAKAVGNYAPRYREGEILAVTEPGLIFRREGELLEPRQVYRLNTRMTGEKPEKVQEFLKPVSSEFKGLDATKEMMNTRAGERAAQRDTLRLEKATQINAKAPAQSAKSDKGAVAAIAKTIGGKAIDAVANIAGEAIEMLGDMFGATAMTPERIEAARDAKERRTAQHEIDMTRFRSDADYRRQVEAQEAQRLQQERERKSFEQERERQR